MIKLFSVKRKKVIHICIGILLFTIVEICCLYFGEEQIQYAMKKQICANVIRYEDMLLEVVRECPSEVLLHYFKKDNYESDRTIYYKDLNNESVNKIFRTFQLISIDKKEDNSVEFQTYPRIITALWGYYMYGFYYTENDEPVDVVDGSEVTETEFETTIVGQWTYWYHTEKITDNFWYYETKIEWYYPTKR